MDEAIIGPARVALLHAPTREIQNIFDLAEGNSYFAPPGMIAIAGAHEGLTIGSIYPAVDSNP